MAKAKQDDPTQESAPNAEADSGALGSIVDGSMSHLTGDMNEEELAKLDSKDEYHLNKKRYLKVSCSHVQNEVEGRFKIDFNKPVPNLNSKLGQAFEAKEIATGNEKDYYAMVLDSRYPIRIAELTKLRNKRVEGFSNVVAAQIVPTSLSKGRRYVAIIERPKGVSVREYFSVNPPLNDLLAIMDIVRQFASIMQFLFRQGVVHGSINIDTVYINEEGLVHIGECISEPCGFSQSVLYEHVDRAICIPIGKGLGERCIDFYALGVVIAYMLTGNNPEAVMSESEIIENKFIRTTYKIMTLEVEFSPQLLDLLRGLLNEKKSEVWTADQLTEWTQGKRFNLLAPANYSESSRPIMFNGKKFNNRKHLVFEFSQNWELAKDFIHDDTLVRWIDRSLQDNDLADRLEVVSSIIRGGLMGEFSRYDEQLAHYILLLDPTGPIRVKDFACNMDGVGPILVHANITEDDKLKNAVDNIFRHNLISLWVDQQSLEHAYEVEGLQDAMFSLEKSEELYKRDNFGFGSDRCLYELNPTLCCQSDVLLDYTIFNVEELLSNLEINESIGNKLVDEHSAAFLTNRLELPRPIRVKTLTRFPEFASNEHIQALSMLAHAQTTKEVKALPLLSRKILNNLNEVLYTFHSKFIRNELERGLEKLVELGDLMSILTFITDAKHLVRDKVGFERAVKLYKRNEIQMLSLGNKRAVTNVGYRFGLQLAVILSFLIATIVFTILVGKYI